MALKIKFTRAQMDIIPSGEVTARVYFTAREDASVGDLQTGINDSVQFTPSFPLTKVSLRNEAVAAVKAKYTGSAEE